MPDADPRGGLDHGTRTPTDYSEGRGPYPDRKQEDAATPAADDDEQA